MSVTLPGSLTFDKAVSRILSPVVDMATGTQKIRS